jgi:transcriptional regulator with XRE-family HTH domain
MTMAPSSPPADLPPRHVRAARALLAWSQQDLAKRAGVATSTVADFERGHRRPVANNAQAIRGALEAAGIRFLPTGAVIGPPIPRIAASGRPGAPIRWVTADDLADWANRTDGVENLPTLIAHLISATHGGAVRLRFPAAEGVRHAGWDGRSNADRSSIYVPQGEAAWEISCKRNNIPKKANENYEKRSRDPGTVGPADAAYIFVTPRHWPQKDQWAKSRKAEGVWRDVRVYDADDLVHWLEQTPAVGLWLAVRMGKRPPSARLLEEVWEEWSLATQWPLTEDLVLSDRDEDAAKVLQWLREGPSVLSIQATTAEEAVAFLHATFGILPEEVADQYRALCLVAADPMAARALINAPAPQIIVLTEPDPGLARTLAERGHFVFQAYDERPVGRGEVRTLARPSREGIANALVGAGIPAARARALARDSARNLTVLRRLIPSAPGRQPAWSLDPPRALLAALLAGGWDEASEADKAKVAELAAQPYDDVAAALAPYVGQFDSPLRKVGTTWRVASPPDAWVPLAPFLMSADLQRFEAVATAVLGAADPRFDMEPNERWMAAVQRILPDYSEMLRHGVGQVLILLALWGDRVRTATDAHRRADAVVGALLRNADERRWWSLSRDFRLLAEASPSAFMSAIEDSLAQNDPPIRALFGSDEGGMFATEHLSDLLWALEALAWSPELLPRVSLVLARLDTLDTPRGKKANRPANSLRQIHLLWYPQTNATLDQRLKALDLIRKRETNPAWRLMMGILPEGHDASHPSPTPLRRDYSVNKVESVTWPLIGRGATAISARLLEDVGVDPVRWQLLIDRIADMADREAVFTALEAAEPHITDKRDRTAVWDRLRGLLHQHRQFPDAEWAMPAEDLDRIARIYERFAPTDPLERVAWLFETSVQLPNPSAEGWQSEARDVAQARQDAALTVFLAQGADGVLRLARLVSAAGFLGKALYDAGGADLDPLIEAAVRGEDAHERDVAHGLIMSMFRDRKEPWAGALIQRARDEGWGDTALMTILRALPHNGWTWDHVAAIGSDFEAAYWRQAPIWWIDDDEAAEHAIRKLVSAGRARDALALAGRGGGGGRGPHLPSTLLVETLRAAVRRPLGENGDRNGPTMFQHFVVEILHTLDMRDDVDANDLANLEWLYLPVLTHSRRPAKVLVNALAEQPGLFIEMIRAVFKPSEESGYIDPPLADPQHARAVANQAYRLLDHWDRLPGQGDDRVIDGVKLEAWIREARALAREIGRGEVADSRIGTMLSASPNGMDGNWPAEPVRAVLDLYRNPAITNGFKVGKTNRRGVTTRLPRDGGQQERDEAARYRLWSGEIIVDYPYTARVLDELAEYYEDDARRQDEAAERLDWEI